jgi:hypothetical protein
VTELGGLLRSAAAGHPPPADGAVTVLAPPDVRSVGVFAFTAHHVVSASADSSWVHSMVSDDLSAPLNPPFLSALSARLGAVVNNIDVVLAGFGTGVPTGLTPADGVDHPRVVRAFAYRTDVRMWTVPGGLAVLGRGVAGRYEVAVEVADQGRGIGRSLFAAVLGEVSPGEPVWAQVAPGNVASLRAVLAAGYRPIGAEALLVAA